MQAELQQTKLISIGIPIYNAELYLTDAIKSVIAQTYQNWELILVDDGSKDNSLEIAKVFEKQDSRIRVISDGVNKNLPARLNQIIAESKGKYIARMDADDIMHPKRLETQLQILKDNSNIDVLGTNAYVIDENDLVFGMRYRKNFGLTKVEHFIHPTIMAKKQWFVDNPYDEKAIRIEDAELWFRTKSKSKFMITKEPLLFYREFGGNYYKKYFLANSSKEYILKKYDDSSYWKEFFNKNQLKGLVYKFFSLSNNEQILINRRNEVIYKQKKPYAEYLK